MTLDKIFITKPILPSINLLQESISEIWQSGQVTNYGAKHVALEKKLRSYLEVANISLFNNGTIALLVALKALDLPCGSEVITTPFTFPATTHAIFWNGLKVIFADIDEKTMCIDANKIESLITKNTSAILATHVYGYCCDVEKISKIAKKHNLKVVYDAAHAFDTKIDGKAVGKYGDITMHSFHATKLFNTIEGGCLVCNDESLNAKIRLLSNFGIKNEEEVLDCGINGKMNEIQAAIGLLNLDLVAEEKKKRKVIFDLYQNLLSGIKGLGLMNFDDNHTNSLQYFVTRIDSDISLVTRDEVFERLKENNIITRKYFYPLCSEYSIYKNIPSSNKANLMVANKVKREVLCLPFYGDLPLNKVEEICEIIKKLMI
jgi:dTDP-4-amino-4,6-dideoxygalactose transaminase